MDWVTLVQGCPKFLFVLKFFTRFICGSTIPSLTCNVSRGINFWKCARQTYTRHNYDNEKFRKWPARKHGVYWTRFHIRQLVWRDMVKTSGQHLHWTKGLKYLHAPQFVGFLPRKACGRNLHQTALPLQTIIIRRSIETNTSQKLLRSHSISYHLSSPYTRLLFLG